MKPVQNVQNMKPVQYAQDSYVAFFSRHFFFKFEINEYSNIFIFLGGWGGGGDGVAVEVEVIFEDIISETE